MSDDPFKEASKYNTAVRNVDRWVARRTAAIKEEATRKYHELRQALSPAAARIVVAAEMQEHVPPEVFHTAPSSGFVGKGIVEQLDAEGLVSPDPSPAPAWLNQEPAPLPAGALLEVPEKPARRRA